MAASHELCMHALLRFVAAGLAKNEPDPLPGAVPPNRKQTRELLMTRDKIPDDVRRFILTSVPSVPYLEAMLLLRSVPDEKWDGKRVAQRLYISEKRGVELLVSLHEAGIASSCPPSPGFAELQPVQYCYGPALNGLSELVDSLADTYTRNLVDVTNLIHANSGSASKVQQFADAFKWRKDS